MAEAAAIVGLVASIASLVDLSAKVVSRLRDFTSKSSDVPESFRSLSTRLPLLTTTLQNIRSQAEAGRLPEDVTKALKAVIDDTFEQIASVQDFLSKVLPSDGDSKLERALKALKSLAKDDRVKKSLEKIYKNNDILLLHQATRNVDTDDRILEGLSKLSVKPPTSFISFGVCLGQAPQVPADAFIGREKELQQLRDWLSPKGKPNGQRIVSIFGLGGLGKTQLSLAHTRDCGDDYSSVFWVNAKDETSLRQSMADWSAVIFSEPASPVAPGADNEKLKIDKVKKWLSEPKNDRWLLIFDNYDDPKLPGIESSTGYDIRVYFPHRSQGSILITTRSPLLQFAKKLQLKKVEDIEQSIAILAVKSGREVSGENDASARRLARRLDGLPLALATAGAYLSQSTDSFDEYLESYNDSWSDLSQYSRGLMDYEDRTLFSTWNLSFQIVQAQDPEAAELLKLMAYLDNQDLWYELFHKDVKDAPAWWTEVTKSRARFNRAISTLHSYSLLEMSAGQCSMHMCEHDWTLEYLNHQFDQERFRIAVHCVAANVKSDNESENWVTNRRVLPHARRFQNHRAKSVVDWKRIGPLETYRLAYLYYKNDMSVAAEEMYMRTLREYENQGLEHTETLNLVNNLGILYKDQGKLEKAENMYMRALRGYEKQGIEHTLKTINNLGLLYANQGKLEKAEKMYMRALRGYEKAWESEHTSTLDTFHNLGILFFNQGKLAEAEKMYMRALRGYEKQGLEHTLDTINSLGNLYSDQGRLAEAEEMYMRALRGYEKAWGSEHTSTLDTFHNLGILYKKLGKTDPNKFTMAEDMYMRALRGLEKTLGLEHTSTLSTVNNLGLLYTILGRTNSNKFKIAEEMHMRALQGREKALGFEHTSTLDTVNNLGVLYQEMGRLTEAEEMYTRAVRGSENAVGKGHRKTQRYSNSLRIIQETLQACEGHDS
ncbi:MAG: hypothetical protein Q9195_008985 [Heterodermia aff. obscurata]